MFVLLLLLPRVQTSPPQSWGAAFFPRPPLPRVHTSSDSDADADAAAAPCRLVAPSLWPLPTIIVSPDPWPTPRLANTWNHGPPPTEYFRFRFALVSGLWRWSRAQAWESHGRSVDGGFLLYPVVAAKIISFLTLSPIHCVELFTHL